MIHENAIPQLVTESFRGFDSLSMNHVHVRLF